MENDLDPRDTAMAKEVELSKAIVSLSGKINPRQSIYNPVAYSAKKVKLFLSSNPIRNVHKKCYPNTFIELYRNSSETPRDL